MFFKGCSQSGMHFFPQGKRAEIQMETITTILDTIHSLVQCTLYARCDVYKKQNEESGQCGNTYCN
jgi:hypothetical protein